MILMSSNCLQLKLLNVKPLTRDLLEQSLAMHCGANIK